MGIRRIKIYKKVGFEKLIFHSKYSGSAGLWKLYQN